MAYHDQIYIQVLGKKWNLVQRITDCEVPRRVYSSHCELLQTFLEHFFDRVANDIDRYRRHDFRPVHPRGVTDHRKDMQLCAELLRQPGAVCERVLPFTGSVVTEKYAVEG
jgi:histone H3/H4